MKKLRNFYFIIGLFAIAFALVAKHIPGVTITDFVRGFFDGLGITMLIAGLITSAIPSFYRNDKKKEAADAHAAHGTKTPATTSDAGISAQDTAPRDTSSI